MKNNKDIILKKLADKYVYENYRLTNEEYKMLQESDFYKHILYPRESLFDTIVENAIVDTNDTPDIKITVHDHDGTVNSLDVDRDAYRDMVDSIESNKKYMHALNPHSVHYPDDNSVNIDELKKDLASYACDHIHHHRTNKSLLDILKRSNTVRELMYNLYSAAGI